MAISDNEDMFACDWGMPPQGRDSVPIPALSRSTTAAAVASQFGGALYSDFFAQGLTHFFPAARLDENGRTATARADFLCDCKTERSKSDQVLLDWLGQRYALRRAMRPFTDGERKLIYAMGRVLTARYQALFNPDIAAKNFHLFRGLPEDRYVSAFLDPAPYASLETLTGKQDRVADAIEALRSSALTTSENRRVSTGALLLGRQARPPQFVAEGRLRYSSALTSIRSFPHLCDGTHTVALVDTQGRWIDIVDVEQWSGPGGGVLPLPSPSAYRAHCRATLGSDNLCLVLTPNGEIKVFARGVQVFSLLNGRWRLTDLEWKYRRWADAVQDVALANLVFQVALDLADSRSGGLFVILDDAASAKGLVSPGDLLTHPEPETLAVRAADPKRSVYYLLNGRRATDLRPAVLRTLAALDGGTVVDREGRLLAFGAILSHHNEVQTTIKQLPQGGGRSVAALAASRYGKSLKISEDGIISFFESGSWVWDV